MENQWYYGLHGETLGPLSESEIKKFFQSGLLNLNTQVWCEAMAEWKPAKDIEVFKLSVPPTPPPLPRQKIQPPSIDNKPVNRFKPQAWINGNHVLLWYFVACFIAVGVSYFLNQTYQKMDAIGFMNLVLIIWLSIYTKGMSIRKRTAIVIGGWLLNAVLFILLYFLLIPYVAALNSWWKAALLVFISSTLILLSVRHYANKPHSHTASL